jgi:hypothetical protein
MKSGQAGKLPPLTSDKIFMRSFYPIELYNASKATSLKKPHTLARTGIMCYIDKNLSAGVYRYKYMLCSLNPLTKLLSFFRDYYHTLEVFKQVEKSYD